MHRHIHQWVFRPLIALAGCAHPGGFVALVLPNAKHIVARPPGIITVRKTLAVKGRHQGIHHLLGQLFAIQCPAVHIGDDCHIFRPLHPTFQLQRCYAHAVELPQMGDQTVVLQAQRVPVFPAAVTVALAAGLGAPSPIAAAAANGGGQIALAGIAHAQCAVTEDLDLNGRMLADIANLLPAQFPAEHHPAQTPGRAQQHAGQGVNGHLGGAVQRNGRGDPAAKLHHAQILDDKGIHAAFGCGFDQFDALRDFLIRHQRIERQMHRHTPDMAVFDCLSQGLNGKILCALTGIKCAAAQVNSVGAILYRRPQGIHAPRGSQQFDHTRFS